MALGGSATTAPPRYSGAPVYASRAPLYTAMAFLVASVVLVIVSLILAHSQQLIGINLPLVPLEAWPIPTAGYLLTPIGVIACLGWDRIAQQRGLRDRRFVARPAYARYLSWLAVAGFVIGLWHIVNIAYLIDSVISDPGAGL